MFAQEQLIKDYATSQGITVDEDSIEQQVSTAKESVGGTDNTWLTSLQSQGYTDEADYRDYLETTYLSHQISQTLAPTVDDATLLQAVQQNPSSLVGKRSSVIVLGTQSVQNGEDVQTLASDIENQIATGTDFAALAQSYSIDSVSAQSGGDMGWEAALKATEEAGGSGPDQTYFDTLDKLAVGQVSQPVAIADSTGAASGNYEIIKCTDEFNVPAGGVTSLSQLPQDMTSELRNGLTEYNQESAFSQWLQAQMQSADIQINDMPSNLPYDVDMSLAQSSSSSSSSGSQSSSSAGTASTGSSSSSSGSVFTGSSTGAAADGGLISTLPEGSDGN
jgi:foldase protein PrsA